MSEEYIPTVEIEGEPYGPEELASNSDEIVLNTGENRYNLDEVELELRGWNNLDQEVQDDIAVLKEFYEIRHPDSAPKLIIRGGKGPGHPIVGGKLENITSHLEPAETENPSPEY